MLQLEIHISYKFLLENSCYLLNVLGEDAGNRDRSKKEREEEKQGGQFYGP